MDKEKPFENKVYCCSNSPRPEAVKLGGFDILASLGFLAFCSWGAYVVKQTPQYFRELTESKNESAASDFRFLNNFENQQDFFLAGILLWCILSMFLGVMLLHGAYKRRSGLLKLWFALTFLEVIMSLFVVVLAIMYLDRKVVIGAISLMVYLYKWYELWIALHLIREMRPLSKVCTTDSDKLTPAFNIEDTENPEQSAVYTIEGDRMGSASSQKPLKEDE